MTTEKVIVTTDAVDLLSFRKWLPIQNDAPKPTDAVVASERPVDGPYRIVERFKASISLRQRLDDAALEQSADDRADRNPVRASRLP